jgi:Family of unknown function (DUF5908)
MPIEIKEVVIRAVVSGSGGGPPKQGPSSTDKDQASGSPDSSVSEAVRNVLDILKDREER